MLTLQRLVESCARKTTSVYSGPTGFTTLTVSSRHLTQAGLLMQTEPLDRNLVSECLIGCRGSFQTTIYGYRLYSELIICLNLDNVEILLNLRFLTSIKAKKTSFITRSRAAGLKSSRNYDRDKETLLSWDVDPYIYQTLTLHCSLQLSLRGSSSPGCHFSSPLHGN